MPNYILTNTLRKQRFEHAEMTQQTLADKAQVSRQTIVSIEKGKYSPSLELAFKLARVFDIKLEELFAYELEK